MLESLGNTHISTLSHYIRVSHDPHAIWYLPTRENPLAQTAHKSCMQYQSPSGSIKLTHITNESDNMEWMVTIVRFLPQSHNLFEAPYSMTPYVSRIDPQTPHLYNQLSLQTREPQPNSPSPLTPSLLTTIISPPISLILPIKRNAYTQNLDLLILT